MEDYFKRSALEKDYGILVNEDTLVTENGEPKILYIKLDPNLTEEARKAVLEIKYSAGYRTRGLSSTSRTFGYRPRNPMRQYFCSASSLGAESPNLHAGICEFGAELAKLYKKYFPGIYSAHVEEAKHKIKEEWRLSGSPFTSGIVNKNNPLKYHFDAGNLKNVLSNMIIFKRYVAGGFLSCPEYDIGFEVADNTAILFDGQNILHGVTPIKKTSPNAYRYSIVYYTLQQMWSCLPITEEIQFARSKRLIREKRRASGILTMADMERDNKKDKKSGRKK